MGRGRFTGKGMDWKVVPGDARSGRAHPEFIVPRPWKFRTEGDRGCVSIDQAVFIAPLGDRVVDRMTRTHEMGHVSFTPGGSPESLFEKYAGRKPEPIEVQMLQVAEDCRINHLTNRHGFRPDGAVESERFIQGELGERLNEFFAHSDMEGLEDSSRQLFSLLSYFCLIPFCNRISHQTANACFPGSPFPAILRRIASPLLAEPSFANTVKTAITLADLFPPSDRIKVANLIRGLMGVWGRAGDVEAETSKPGAPDNVVDGPEVPYRFAPDFYLPVSVKDALEGVSMEVYTCKMPNRKRVGCGLERRPVDLGLVPRYVQRFGWGPMFNDKVNAYAGGSILVDWSGSMGIKPETVYTLLEQAPLSTFAFYSANGRNEGRLVICAEKGKYADFEEMASQRVGGANIVDLYALQWLARQPKPRVWISDGIVTGKRDNQYSAITNYLNKHVLKPFNIRRFGRVDWALEAFANRKKFRMIRGAYNPFRFMEEHKAL